MKPVARAQPSYAAHLTAFGASLVLSLAAYSPGVRAQFVSDDVNAIVENEWVAGPLDPGGILTNFSWWGSGRSDAPGYRPLVTLSFALNRAAGGAAPFGFHLTNIVLHAVVGWLTFAVAVALGVGVWSAGAAALATSVLPIHSEAVIWAVGRAELGAATAFLAVAWLTLRYRLEPRTGYLVAAATALFLGMLCKENAVTVLAAPAIYALTLKGDARMRRRDAIATATLLASFVVYIGARIAAAGPALPGPEDSLLDNPLSVLSLPSRLLGAVSVLGRYLWLSLWPHPLSVDYSFNALEIRQGFVLDRYVLVAVGLFLLVASSAWHRRHRSPAVAASVLLAAASYSIVSNTIFPIGTIMGERLFYLPSALLCIAAAAALDPLLITPHRRSATSSPARTVAVVAFAALLLVWTAVDRRRAAEWMTPVTLFESAVAAVPQSSRAHMELGSAYGHDGRIDEARKHFEQAMAIYPGYTVAAYNFGNALVRAQRFGEAEAAYRKAVALDARLVRAWHNLALVYTVLKRKNEAADAFMKAAELAPRDVDIRLQQADALLAVGRDREAISALDAAIGLGADTAVARFNRGVARQRVDGCATALEDYQASASRPRAPVQAVQAAIGCLQQLGRHDEAQALAQSSKVANQGTRR